MYAIDDLEAFPRSVLILDGPISSEFPAGLEDVVSANETFLFFSFSISQSSNILYMK